MGLSVALYESISVLNLVQEVSGARASTARRTQVD